MHTIERIVDDTNLKSGDGFATVWGRIYGNWITDEVNKCTLDYGTYRVFFFLSC